MDMDNVEYAYTRGMDDEEAVERLRTAETGVLALARDDEAYAVPLAHYYDGESLFFRLGKTPGDRKTAFAAATAMATYVVYGTEPTDDPEELSSWSVLVRGRLRELSPEERERFDATEINEAFAPIRVFDEPIEEIEIGILELEIESIAGRATGA